MWHKRIAPAAAALGGILLFASCSQQPAAKPAESAKQTEAALPAKATATIDTTEGKMTCELLPKVAPRNVANFIGLAEGTKEWTHPTNGRKVKFHLYDGTIFHRVIPNFMIQGGDPAGTGAGGPGYELPDEVSADVKFDRAGRMAMANTGRDSNGSQFFITEKPAQHLDGRFTIIGQCDKAAVELVKKIAREPRDTATDKPFHPVKINTITIQKDNS